MDPAFDAIIKRLRDAQSLLALTHARPDGDALGSVVALAQGAAAAGKTARMLVPDCIPPRYAFLFAGAPVAKAAEFEALAAQADLVVILDTCALAQLDGLAGPLAVVRDKVVVVDHHTAPEDIAAVRWIDTSAAAAGMMVAWLLDALGWPVSGRTAEALMTAVTSDTGWLRFANTDRRALEAVGRWVEMGVRPDMLYRKLYQTDRAERLALVGRVIESMEFHCGGRLAVMTLRASDFDGTGARPDETENLVNEALRIGTVETAVIVVENTGGLRASLRSRDAVDVAAIARRFGGGGHRRAAALKAVDHVESLKEQLIAACTKALKAAGIED